MDVMVVWTPAARSAVGGVTQMQNLVNLAVAETNQSYINSNMTQRINLTHMEEVAYTESGDMGTDLDRLTNASDGYIDHVHTLRNTYHADLVSMFSESSQYCGIGWMMSTVSPSFEDSAFTVVAQTCATGYYSFAHEMGHNEGRGTSGIPIPAPRPTRYAHGYAYIPGQWRTIMAYDASCQASGVSCTRLQYWSNPGLLYNGVAMGVSGGSNPADNHLALNNTCSTVANFRDEPDAPGVFGKSAPANGATGVSSSPTLSWGASSGATSYEFCYDTTNDSACSGWTGNGSATSKALSGLSGSTTYYWHVRAVNSAGTTYSDSNTMWSFTTQAPMPPGWFDKTAPANGATGVTINPTLRWDSSNNAASYEYCYDTTNDAACSPWSGNGSATSKMLTWAERRDDLLLARAGGQFRRDDLFQQRYLVELHHAAGHVYQLVPDAHCQELADLRAALRRQLRQRQQRLAGRQFRQCAVRVQQRRISHPGALNQLVGRRAQQLPGDKLHHRSRAA